MSLVVVPSYHVERTFRASGVLTVPIMVVPEAFPDVIANDAVSVFDPGLSTDFNFLVFGQLTGNNPHNDRKNTMFALKWLCEEFAGDSSVGVVIKTNSGRESKIDRQITSDVIRKLIGEVRKGPFPRINLLHGRLTNEQVAGLYVNPKIKGLVSPTRGEGFGLPLLEASASGLPVIATGWSGHMDFMSKGKFIKLDYDLREVHESRIDDNIFMRGSRWAEVSEADFKKKVKKFRQSPDVPKQWAQELRTKLLTSNSQAVINTFWDRTLP
jgi:glycosyltransferase involved in cell wall biosynthesis